MTDLEEGRRGMPNQSVPLVTCSCRPPVILTIIGVPHDKDSSVAKPNPSASEMLMVQSVIDHVVIGAADLEKPHEKFVLSRGVPSAEFEKICNEVIKEDNKPPVHDSANAILNFFF